MCHRMSPLLFAELQEALQALRREGRARVPQREDDTVVPDAYPGTQVPLFVVDESGALDVATLSWGFDAPPSSRSRLVFNTRIETALSQARSGTGLWAGPISNGRCLVPVRGFYERWTMPSVRKGAQVRFTMPRHQVFLLAGVRNDERFSVVTTTPNADVAAVHSRMPLVLAPGESAVWLGPDYASLADRSSLHLEAQEERSHQLF